MIFDTSNLNNLSMSYIYKLTKFTSQLKKLEIQYMKASILLIKSDFVRSLYTFYLNIQRPISKVYIVKEDKDLNIISNKLLKNENIVGYTEYNP